MEMINFFTGPTQLPIFTIENNKLLEGDKNYTKYKYPKGLNKYNLLHNF